MLKTRFAFLLMGATALLATPLSAVEAKTTLRVQTSTQAGGFTFRYLKEQWVPKLEEMTGGEITIEFLPIKSVMPHKETPDGVAAGVLDGDLTSVAYFTGRNPAFAILGDLIAGYDKPEQMQAFCREGGGAEALQALWDKVMKGRIHVIGCGPVSREALVAGIPIRGVADLEGVKIRSPEGLAADVFRRAGATPVAIPFSEVFTSIEKGIVQAADAAAYVNNDANGFHQIAKYPLYPGIHSMAVHQFTLNKKKWDGLSDDHKAALQKWFYDAYADTASAAREQDQKLVERDRVDGKIEVIDWPQAERDKFRAIAQEAWHEVAKKSPQAQSALDAHLGYMKKTGLLK